VLQNHFDLVKDLGYSESAAYRRMQAARILQAVPEAAGKLESGALGLTVLSKVQTLIRADEKRTGERMSIQEKSEILTKVESCSGREAEHRLAQHFPEVAAVPSEKVRAISEDQISVQVTFTRVQFEKLKRIQELLSHTHLGSSSAELLDAAMDVFLEKKDPLKRTVKPRAAPCDTAVEVDVPDVQPANSLKPSTRNVMLRKSGGQCEYRETKMGHRCASRHFLEIDHIRPRGLGGTNHPDNLRVLCRTHNLLVAERVFGREKIEAFRRRT
jgi:hypothetical protein